MDYIETKVNKYDGTLKDFTVKDGNREFIAMITTAGVDRDGDVVDPKGMDLTKFNKNPVIFLNHASHRFPIGKALWLRLHTDTEGKKGIMAKGFISEATQEANEAFGLMQEEILTTTSIGFGIKENGARLPTEKEVKSFPGIKRMITETELYEFSIVGVPANTDAVIQQVSKMKNKPKWLDVEEPKEDVEIKDLDMTPTVEIEDIIDTYELIDLEDVIPLTDLVPIESFEKQAAEEAIEIYDIVALGRVSR